MIGVGVMGAARQMAGQAVLQRQSGSEHGAAHRQPGALHQRRGGWQADAALLLMAELPAGKGPVVARPMHQLQPTARRR